jgi:regulator of replication initiation timing
MIEEMQAAMAAVGAVREMVKVTFNAKVDSHASERVFEAMDKLGTVSDTLYAMRDELFRLQAENEKLRREAKDQQALQERLQKYALQVTPGGAVVQVHKEDPPHFACPVCINAGRVEVLQPRVVRGRHVCPSCSAQYAVEPFVPKAQRPSRPPTHWMGQ